MSEEIKALVLRTNEEILNKGNLAYVDEVFATDYVLHGTRGDRHGPEVIKGFVTELRTAFPDLHVNIDNFVAEGDRVAWQRTHRGTHQGELSGTPATGRSVKWRTIVISRIVGGKIVEEWGASDLSDQLRGS
jgi:steroid delta-isomerase-like uncharacterized protein